MQSPNIWIQHSDTPRAARLLVGFSGHMRHDVPVRAAPRRTRVVSTTAELRIALAQGFGASIAIHQLLLEGGKGAAVAASRIADVWTHGRIYSDRTPR